MKKLKALTCVVSALVLCVGLFAGCGETDGGESEGPCTHTNLTKVDGKDATCLEEGNFAYYVCECGALFSDKNGKKPTTVQAVTIEKTSHDMHWYDEKVNSYDGYYFCDTCGRYYSDSLGASELPYENFTDSSVSPVALANGWTDSRGASTPSRDFTLRCFIGWTDGTQRGYSQLPDNATLWVNVNLNRKCTLESKGWYNFGVAYNNQNGLQFKDFEAGNLTKVSAPEFTKLFEEKGGIWVRVVRKGTDCSFYFEDKYGIPILISKNEHFGADEALYRFAFGIPTEQDNVGLVAGWSLVPAKSEICWGIANPRCVFSER